MYIWKSLPKYVYYLPKFYLFSYFRKYYLIYNISQNLKMILNMYNKILIKIKFNEGILKILQKCCTYLRIYCCFIYIQFKFSKVFINIYICEYFFKYTLIHLFLNTFVKVFFNFVKMLYI